MASSAPMDKSDEMPEGDQSPEKTGVPAAGDPWWRQWFGPGVAATIISALVIALVTVGVTGFNSLKGDIRDLKLDITASETRVREDMKAFRTEVKGDMKDFRTEVKGDLAGLRTEVKGDMKDFRTEVKADLVNLRTEVKGDMKDFRTEVKADLVNLRTEVKGDMKDFRAEVKADLADLRAGNRVLNDKLDRVLEVVLAGKS